MKQMIKVKQWYFGAKAHVGADPYGRVGNVVLTNASVHDSQIMGDLVHGEELAFLRGQGTAILRQYSSPIFNAPKFRCFSEFSGSVFPQGR